MATLYTIEDIKILERRIATIHCQALGLNTHFPRAVLYGPCELGGMEIGTLQFLLTTIRINYFLYHTRQQMSVGKKLEISMANMHIKAGLSKQVLLSSYQRYQHLATKSLVKCLCGETERFGLFIKGHTDAIWTPTLQGEADVPLTEFVANHFSSTNVYTLNRCRLYLQVFTIYDLYTHNGSDIHPEIAMG